MNALAPIFALFVTTASAFAAGDATWDAFVEHARAEHGAFGARAAEFLVEHRPPGDADLPLELLVENLDYALRARDEFPWARELPEDVFFNDVLPYASLDETREAWRADFYAKAAPIVADCTTASEAAQALNRQFFNLVNVHYNTKRKAPNQSPSESIEQGAATCTGLSILLVDACRAVGVPARVAGTALWTNKRGNHTWVEIWDGDWFFAGADEPDPKGLNRGWFKGDASRARADDWMHAVWASSWRDTGDAFPMVWDLESRDVPAVNVTHRYAEGEPVAPKLAVWNLRVRDVPGGERLVARVELIDGDGTAIQSVTTRAGRADLNDMPDVRVAPGATRVLRVVVGEEARTATLTAGEAGAVTHDLAWSELSEGPLAVTLVDAWLASGRAGAAPSVPLDLDAVGRVTVTLLNDHVARLANERAIEHAAETVVADDVTMRWKRREFGEAPYGRRSLWISMHGGGGAPTEVNDQQWSNQVRLYEPDEGVYVAPRAPTDTWNLWHQAHIDALFARLIENHVVFDGVDPNRVYLMGYSAGGDGVYQLAPRMADRFAAASMMAGHPNDASPLGLRNLPFAIFMGGDDAAYKRNEVAAQWGARLDELAADDPGGYPHRVDIFEGLGHWMDRRDAVAVPWMAGFDRDPWPAKVVWHQAGRTHDRFAWLAVPSGTAERGDLVVAQVDGQTIAITSDDVERLTLRLSDALLDLDAPVTVTWNGVTVHERAVTRRAAAIDASLAARFDPPAVATAELTVKRPADEG